MHPSDPSLSEWQIAQYRDQGFLALDLVTTPEDLKRIQDLLDGLFARFNTLPRTIALDLAADGSMEGTSPRIPEINRAVHLAPELLDTLAFRNCREIARQLLGHKVNFWGDHAIYKPPHNHKETPWHQDQAYLGHPFVGRTVSFWLPLQAATLEMGCMKFIPGSQRQGMLPHYKWGHNPKAYALTTDPGDLSTVVVCPIPAGGVTIHSPLTLHATGPNDTDTLRRAWIFAFSANSRYGVVRTATVAVAVTRKLRAKVAE
jgi:hypothetical protein